MADSIGDHDPGPTAGESGIRVSGGRRWRIGAAVAAALGAVAWTCTGLVAGVMQGAVFELDPTSPRWLGIGLHGLVVLAFGAVGVVVCLVAVVTAGGLVACRPWARIVGLVLGALYFVTGLLPFGVALLYGLTRPEVHADFRNSVARPDDRPGGGSRA